MFAAYTHGRSSHIDNEFLWRKDGGLLRHKAAPTNTYHCSCRLDMLDEQQLLGPGMLTAWRPLKI